MRKFCTHTKKLFKGEILRLSFFNLLNVVSVFKKHFCEVGVHTPYIPQAECLRAQIHCEAEGYQGSNPAGHQTAAEGTAQAFSSSSPLTNAIIKTFLCAGSDTGSFAKCPVPTEFSSKLKKNLLKSKTDISNTISYGAIPIHFSVQERGRERRTFLMPKGLSDARCGSPTWLTVFQVMR